jgi:hypothetical protein
MPAGHKVDSNSGRVRFLAGLGKKDQVPIQDRTRALDQNHCHEHRDEFVFVVDCAPTPDVSILHYRAERIDGPFLRRDGNDIRVR